MTKSGYTEGVGTVEGNYIPRCIEADIASKLNGEIRRAIVLYGARRTGKTSLVRHLMEGIYPDSQLYINADDMPYAEVLSSKNFARISSLVSGYKLVVIDEAQRIPDVGLSLKLILDNMRDIRLIVTGSSSLELGSKVSEPLTGRKFVYNLYPFALQEISRQYDFVALQQLCREVILRFGLYPEVFLADNESMRIEILKELVDSYVMKDVLELEEIRYPFKLKQLLQLLAYQVGQLVSFAELASKLGISRTAVERYINLLEASFVIFRVHGFSRNRRNEMSKMPKIYFWDVGIRNALIGDFRPIDLRNDLGQLWENFIIVERLKQFACRREFVNFYFWRKSTGAEVDWVEERNGELRGYEIKLSPSRRHRHKDSWLSAYKNAHYSLITWDNFLDFVLPKER